MFLKLIRTFCAGVTLLVLLVSFTPAVPAVAGKMATDWYAGDADVLIVLGGSMLVGGTGPRATLGYDSYLRCVYAWWNIQQFKYTYILVTGNDGTAEAMAAFFRDKGVAGNSILIENRAASTFQNAEFAKNLLQAKTHLPANARIALVTSDYHCLRAQKVFFRRGLRVRVTPAPDLVKQAQSSRARWTGFFLLTGEIGKYAVYALEGKL